MSSEIVMKNYVLYESPSDYPGKFVVREWIITRKDIKKSKVISVSSTHEKASKSVPYNMSFLLRCEDDDPCIVGVWI